MHNISTLADLREGECAIIGDLSSTGSIRRRIQDVGLIPGTKVKCVQKSPLGDPVAYLVRGTVIALRSEDSANVIIKDRAMKGANVRKTNENCRIAALAGMPNVGKSTIFNALTGMRQHTGNWAGKTVSNAHGHCKYRDCEYTIVDLPGCYSLMANSLEEEIARDFICFDRPDTVIVVCDATCLERSLNLVIQTLEITRNVVICVNFMDEAEDKKIQINLSYLSELLDVPVVGTSARNKKGIDELMEKVHDICVRERTPFKVDYPEYIKTAVSKFATTLETALDRNDINTEWLSLKLLEDNKALISTINKHLNVDLYDDERIGNALNEIKSDWLENGVTKQGIRDDIVQTLVKEAENISERAVVCADDSCDRRDRFLDKIFTSKLTGFPSMVLLLLLIFWLTITGSNYPSQILSEILFSGEKHLLDFFLWINFPSFLTEMLVLGVYRVLAWVISVMLPPMAIFFPLFTLMEDFGYLPRIAFNLDSIYKKCHACGKQALTMCMGFGCNAAGVVGCRIIDSPRERLVAIITNNFVPCNGRFPILIAIISMFFIGAEGGFANTALSAILLTFFVILGVLMTFFTSKLLSQTILKGVPSSFTLELPPYRKPQVGSIIVRSIFDRTLFVLGRAVIAAVPAGFIIWMLANITI